MTKVNDGKMLKSYDPPVLVNFGEVAEITRGGDVAAIIDSTVGWYHKPTGTHVSPF